MIKILKLLFLTALLMTLAAAQTTTIYQIGSAGCHTNISCEIFGPNETTSLWWDSAPNADFAIFNVNAWTPEFVTLDSYECGGASSNPAPVFTSATDGSCSGIDSNGRAFQMAWTVTGQWVRQGRWYLFAVSGATITIVQ